MGDVYGGVTSAVGVIGKFEEVNGDGDGDGDGDGRWRWRRSAGRMARAWGLWAWRLARQKLLYITYLTLRYLVPLPPTVLLEVVPTYLTS